MRLLLTLVTLALVAPCARADFLAGFAERDISPDIGAEAPGGYGKAFHRSLHDPCKVRVAVFDDGAKRVALVGIDALGIHRETVTNVRKAIAKKTGLAENAILIGASHSHSAGPLNGTWPGEYDHADALVKRLATKESTEADPKYVAKVEKAIIDAVCAAHDGRAKAKAGIGRGAERTVAFNRRFKMRSGHAVSHPGQGNPNIAEPAGPTDPEVGVIGAWDAKGKLLGCVVNFACHATTSSGGISASYICYLEKVIQGYYGKDTVVVFLNGASGDITQVDNQSPRRHMAPDQWSQYVGGRVGAEALKVLLNMEPAALVPVDFSTKLLTLNRRVPSPERVKAARALLESKPYKGADTELAFAKETVMLDALLKKGPTVEAEAQAVQVGPAVFLTTPAEYFCKYGLEQKAKSGFPFTFPVSLANGCVGYVPTEEALGDGPDAGGYETRLTSYSNLEVTAGSKLRDAGIEQAKKMKPGTVPTPPKPNPFAGKAWSYGDVPPERK